MKTTMRISSKLIVWLSLALLAAPAQASSVEQNEKIDAAIEILDKTGTLPEQDIPPALLKNAEGIAVIPNLIKAGFVVGGSYGKGVLTVRDAAGRWSAPMFIKLAAGSFGWQIGAQSTDVVLVFKTRRSVEGIIKGTFKLGADAAVAAGPVGRRGEAATDANLKAEILSYSRSRGLFAGVSLEGAKLDMDHDANEGYYGHSIKAGDILDGKVVPPASAVRFNSAILRAMSR